jgi:hypothetical protein
MKEEKSLNAQLQEKQLANLEMHLVVVLPSSHYISQFDDALDAATGFVNELGEMLAHIDGASVTMTDYLVEE